MAFLIFLQKMQPITQDLYPLLSYRTSKKDNVSDTKDPQKD